MRLIDADAAIDALRDYLVGKRCPDDGTLTCRLIENEVINKLPSAQPERKTGRWIYGEDDGQDGWYCSECNGFVPWDYKYYGLDNIDFIDNFKVCPFCEADMISRTGADMRGDKHEAD